MALQWPCRRDGWASRRAANFRWAERRAPARVHAKGPLSARAVTLRRVGQGIVDADRWGRCGGSEVEAFD
eukprot:5103508-Pyramimonas_sp.AAC.1